MSKYIYKYCVYTNNARDGVQFITAFSMLEDALKKKRNIQYNGGGCCDVVKKRFTIGATIPQNRAINNNYKYSDFDIIN